MEPAKPRFTHRVDLRNSDIRTEAKLITLIGYGNYKRGSDYGPERLAFIWTSERIAKSLASRGADMVEIHPRVARKMPVQWTHRFYFDQDASMSLEALIAEFGEDMFAVREWQGDNSRWNITAIDVMLPLAEQLFDKGLKYDILDADGNVPQAQEEHPQ